VTVHVAAYAQLHTTRIDPNPSRVVPRLVIPYEDAQASYLRTRDLVARIKAFSPEQTASLASALLKRFNRNYDDLSATLVEHAQIVNSVLTDHEYRDFYQELVVGASFTGEFAPEAVAICNPTAVPHPDQSDLREGELRVALGARAIGEGHISTICFFEAVISGNEWDFLPHSDHLDLATIEAGSESNASMFSMFKGYRRRVEMASTNLGEKQSFQHQSSFLSQQLEGLNRWRRFALTRDSRSARSHARDRLYHARFAPDTSLSQRILLPEIADEAHGLEDARLVLFTNENGEQEYRGCYIAFDGRVAAPQLITSPNLREFEIHQLTGPATRDKGLALFPRQISGEHVAIARTNGQDIALARSSDGYFWRLTDVIHSPEYSWELLKTGNCGSPIELDEGWLLIVHGVGPMKCYSFGALLLDKRNPSIVRAKLATPLITTEGSVNTGYVPNAIYSCGSIAHNGTLWIPFSEADKRIRVASVSIDQLLSQMTFTSPGS
jgi:predicted GH43/DUF377 family glycosyl hydrolase